MVEHFRHRHQGSVTGDPPHGARPARTVITRVREAGDQLGGRRHQLPAHSLDRGWVRVVDDELEHFVDAR